MDCIKEWDPPNDDVPLPFDARKRYEAEKKRQMMRRVGLWAATVAGVVALAVGVAMGRTNGWYPFKYQ